MDERKTFQEDKLSSIFPRQVDYYFEKIYTAIHNPPYSRAPEGPFCLREIFDIFSAFKAALCKRGIVSRSNHIQNELDETEYPLVELGYYFTGEGLLTDFRAAAIFAHFAQMKMRDLLCIAAEIDREFERDLKA